MTRRAQGQRGGVAGLAGSLSLLVALLLGVVPVAAFGLEADDAEPQHRATISADAASPTGVTHAFVVTVEQDTGAGWEPLPAGTVVTVSTTDAALVADDGCADGTGDAPDTPALETNVCTVTVASDAPATVTLGVEQVTAPDAAPADLTGADATATHEWVAVSLDVSVDALVRVRDEHPVTVQGSVFASDERIVPLPDGAVVEVAWVGPAGSTIAGSPDTASCTIAGGTCFLDLVSAAAGTGTATLSRVSFPWAGSALSIDLTGRAGVHGDGAPGTASVTWAAFRGEIGPDASGDVGDRHTMTARFAYTTDGVEWLPVPDGSTASYDIDGPVGDVSDDGCGSLVDATCQVGLRSDAPGSVRVTLSSLSVFVPWVGGPRTNPEPDAEAPGGPGGGPVPIVVGADRQGVNLTARLRQGAPGVLDGPAAPRSATMTWAGDPAAISLVLQPVVGDRIEDGDLTYARDFDRTGLPGLEWSPSSEQDKVAVFEYVLTNTGDVALTDVTLRDDRIGVILDGSEGVTLAARASTSFRAAEVFTMAEALGGIVVRSATAGALGGGALVSDVDTTAIRLQTILAGAPGLSLEVTPLVGEGDLRADPDAPGQGIVEWTSAAQISADEQRTVMYEFTVTNTGDVTLYDIEVRHDTLGIVLDPADGVQLLPGASTTVVRAGQHTASATFGAATLAALTVGVPLHETVRSTADASGLLSDGGVEGARATAAALVTARALKGTGTLADTGFGDAGTLLPLALLLLLTGLLVLRSERRRPLAV